MVVVASQFAFASLWLWSGIGKLVGIESFEDAVVAHSVLPVSRVLLWSVPVAEVVLGLGLICIPPSRISALLATLSVSTTALCVLTAYVVIVPDVAIRKGCGCSGASEQVVSTKFGHLTFNASLIAWHLVTIAIAARNRRKGLSVR